MRLVALALLWQIGLFATLTLAFTAASVATPTATIKDGTKVIGRAFTTTVTRSSTPTAISYDRYQGVRYAAPPLSDLRFALPQPTTKSTGPVTATSDGPKCLQGSSLASGTSEDCLFLNINKRSDGQQSGLPVLIFLHGGGLVSGDGNSFNYTTMLDNALNAGVPMIVITVQYRLNVFGFTASKEFDTLRSMTNVGLNLGHQDQRMAINWVRNNIKGFGGDPTRITIMGQSAGAFSVSAQIMGHPSRDTASTDLVFDLNQTIAPFRAAIMMSGAPGGTGVFDVSTKDQQYQRLLAYTKCGGTPATNLACLRSADNATLNKFADMEAQRTQDLGKIPLGYFGFSAVQDGGPFVNINGATGFYATRASIAVNNNSYAHVPVITGSEEDEGTMFANKHLATTDQFQKWILDCFAANQSNATYLDAWTAAFEAYPDDPTKGSPFEAVNKTDRFYSPDTNQYKRAAALYGDIRYQAGRRFFIRQASDPKRGNVAVYNYQYKIPRPVDPAKLGVPHTTDLYKIADNSPLGNNITKFFARFVATTDPNENQNAPVWPKYDGNNSMVEFVNGVKDRINKTMDTYREKEMKNLFTPSFLNATGR